MPSDRPAVPRLRLPRLPAWRSRLPAFVREAANRWLRRDWRGALDQPGPGAGPSGPWLVQGWVVPPGRIGAVGVRLTVRALAADGRLLAQRELPLSEAWMPRPDVARLMGDARTARCGFALWLAGPRRGPAARLEVQARVGESGAPGWRGAVDLVGGGDPPGDPVAGFEETRLDLVGFHGGGFGLGRAVDGTAQMLSAVGWRVQRQPADAPPRSAAAGVVVAQINPDVLPAWLAVAGDRAWPPRRIAYVTWELPVLPPGWIQALSAWATELWAPSRFVAEALRSAGAVLSRLPLHIVPHALPGPDVDPDGGARWTWPERARHPGPRLLCLFDHDSDAGRKGVLDSIALARALARARPRSRPLLVVKRQGAARHPAAAGQVAEALHRAAADLDACLLDGRWPGPALAGLVAGCDVLLSMHRSEGFGLVLAEAIVAGRSVLAGGGGGSGELLAMAGLEPVPGRPEAVARRPAALAGPYLPGPGALWDRPDRRIATRRLLDLVDRPEAARAHALAAAARLRARLCPWALARALPAELRPPGRAAQPPPGCGSRCCCQNSIAAAS